MAYGEPEILFCKFDMHGTMEAHRQHALAAVQKIESNRLLNTPTADIVEEIAGIYSLNIPTLHRTDAEADQREGQVQVVDYFSRDYDGGLGTRRMNGTIVDVTVPFTGDRDFFHPTNYI